MLEYMVFLIIAFIATLISGAFGIGAAIILIPVSSFFIEIKKAIAILTIYFISINLTQIYIYWKNIDWKTFCKKNLS